MSRLLIAAAILAVAAVSSAEAAPKKNNGVVNKCSGTGLCAIEAGGTCDPATGRWQYENRQHAIEQYNNCVSRGLRRVVAPR
jgi:hypothetical protein